MTRTARPAGFCSSLSLEPRSILPAIQPAAPSAAAFQAAAGWSNGAIPAASATQFHASGAQHRQTHQLQHQPRSSTLSSSLAIAPLPSPQSATTPVTTSSAVPAADTAAPPAIALCSPVSCGAAGAARRGFATISGPSSFADGPTRITEHLFLGAHADAMNVALLLSLGIRRILNVAGECTPSTTGSADASVAAMFDVKFVPLRDHSDEDIAAHFDECLRFIREGVERGERVLVHCRMGVSRSTTMVIAYLMRYGTDEARAEALRYGDAFDFVKALRPQVSPNLGFVLSLHQIDRDRGFESPESNAFDSQCGLWCTH